MSHVKNVFVHPSLWHELYGLHKDDHQQCGFNSREQEELERQSAIKMSHEVFRECMANFTKIMNYESSPRFKKQYKEAALLISIYSEYLDEQFNEMFDEIIEMEDIAKMIICNKQLLLKSVQVAHKITEEMELIPEMLASYLHPHAFKNIDKSMSLEKQCAQCVTSYYEKVNKNISTMIRNLELQSFLSDSAVSLEIRRVITGNNIVYKTLKKNLCVLNKKLLEEKKDRPRLCEKEMHFLHNYKESIHNEDDVNLFNWLMFLHTGIIRCSKDVAHELLKLQQFPQKHD